MYFTILKQSKTKYNNHYFESNWNSIKNTWKGLKSFLNIKQISADSLEALLLMVPLFPIKQQSRIFSITIFFFFSIANKTKSNISFSHTHFSDFLKNRLNISFLVSPNDKTEIENVISSLDSNKSVGPNSIPSKLLKKCHFQLTV